MSVAPGEVDNSCVVDQTAQGSICRMFHVCETAPLAVALVSFTVPLSFTWLTVNGPLKKSSPCLWLGSIFTIACCSNSVGAFSAGDVLALIIEIYYSLLALTNKFPVCLY